MALDTSHSSRHLLDNVGSATRDFCMLERNILSHFRLALLLSLLSASVLLRVRLVPEEPTETPHGHTKAGLPMGTVQFLASLAAIGVGWWEFQSDLRNMENMRAFLVTTKRHLVVMMAVAGVVLTTCVILLAKQQEL